MSKKESYRKTLVAGVESEEVRLAGLKAKTQNATTGVPVKDAERIEALEQRIDEGKASLRALSRAQENTGGRPNSRPNDKKGRAWGKLQDSLQDDISMFEGEH